MTTTQLSNLLKQLEEVQATYQDVTQEIQDMHKRLKYVDGLENDFRHLREDFDLTIEDSYALGIEENEMMCERRLIKETLAMFNLVGQQLNVINSQIEHIKQKCKNKSKPRYMARTNEGYKWYEKLIAAGNISKVPFTNPNALAQVNEKIQSSARCAEKPEVLVTQRKREWRAELNGKIIYSHRRLKTVLEHVAELNVDCLLPAEYLYLWDSVKLNQLKKGLQTA